MAVNGVTFVGHHVNKDSGNKGKMTMAFDNCGGHGGADHKYHYHIPPVCLIMSLGGEVPERSDWWLAKNPESQWPKKTTKESPLIGWAMDGFPIFGPYDPITKELQTSGSANCTTTTGSLDACNGKNMSNGQYAYFITPTYPFVPDCLRGSLTGSSVSEGTVTDTVENACPMKGYSPMSVETAKDCEILPQSLYLHVPEEAKWVATTAVSGGLHVVVTGVVALLANPIKIAAACGGGMVSGGRFGSDDSGGVKGSLMRLFFAVFLASLTRSIFLLIDPYHMRNLFPNLLAELLYGLLYPLVNLASLESVYLASPDNPLRSSPALYVGALVVVACQFIFQAVFDGLRAYGKQPAWHWVCQVFYSAWGIIVIGAAILYALKAGKVSWAIASVFSFILVIHSVVLLSVSIGGTASSSYFGMMTWLRFLELAVVVGYAWILMDATKEASEGSGGGVHEDAGFADDIKMPQLPPHIPGPSASEWGGGHDVKAPQEI
uniref:YHYH domain-containing protein n=1 Tax=Hemiselmis andersenii TaxID=464988 RepID=A0A6U4NA45_HEMAN